MDVHVTYRDPTGAWVSCKESNDVFCKRYNLQIFLAVCGIIQTTLEN